MSMMSFASQISLSLDCTDNMRREPLLNTMQCGNPNMLPTMQEVFVSLDTDNNKSNKQKVFDKTPTPNMSASIFHDACSGALLGSMGFVASTMFRLSKEGRFLSTIGGIWVGVHWGENGRRKGGW